MKTLQGYIRVRQELSDQYECNYSVDFETVDEQFIFDLTLNCTPPENTLIEITLEDVVVVQWDYIEQPLARREMSRKDIALIRVIRKGGEITDSDLGRIKKEAEELEHFMKTTNQGYWEEVKVTGYVIENRTQSGIGLSFQFNHPETTKQLKEQNPEGYDKHVYWHGRGGHVSGILGHAYLNSYKAWTYTGGTRTVKHEQGHSFGCPHSTTKNNEYGDPTCIMAKAHAGFAAPQYRNMFQMSEGMIADAKDCHFIVPVEVPEESVREDEHKALFVNSRMLSKRKNNEQSILGLNDWWANDTIFVHSVRTGDFSTISGTPEFKGSIKVGDSMEIGDKIVKNVKSQDGVSMITIDDAEQKEFPKPLDPVPWEPITKQHEGIWHNTDHAYQGIDLWVVPENNQLVGYWFTHHPQGEHSVDLHRKHNGREWYVLDGEIKDGYAEIDIIQTDNDGNSEVVGNGIIKFTEDSAHFRFYTTTLGRDQWKLSKLTSKHDGSEHTGIWETGKFEGYTIARYGDQLVAYYFGYIGWQREWATFSGKDLKSMTKYAPKSQYKSGFGESNEKSDSNDLLKIINEAKKVL